MADDEEKSEISDQDRQYIRTGKMMACFAPAIGCALVGSTLVDWFFGYFAGIISMYFFFGLGWYLGYRTIYKK